MPAPEPRIRRRPVLYIKALAALFAVNTMPEGTLKAWADHGAMDTILPADGGDCEEIPDPFAEAGINVNEVAAMDVNAFNSAALRKVS